MNNAEFIYLHDLITFQLFNEPQIHLGINKSIILAITLTTQASSLLSLTKSCNPNLLVDSSSILTGYK
jgi:hypothetical protein